jgi:hypothetical protein
MDAVVITICLLISRFGFCSHIPSIKCQRNLRSQNIIYGTGYPCINDMEEPVSQLPRHVDLLTNR